MADTTTTPGTSHPGAPAAPVLTRDGLERLQRELRAFQDERRPQLVRQLQRVRLFLDPASNAGAVAVAHGELELIDARIAELEALLEQAQVIGDGPPSPTVRPGSRVTVRYEDGSEETLTLVGPLEASALGGRISIDSLAGQALVGKAPGASVTVGEDADALSLTVVAIDMPSESDDAGAER